MGNYSSRQDYMLWEGLTFSVGLGITIVVVVTALIIYLCQRKSRLVIAGEMLLRAERCFTKARALLPDGPPIPVPPIPVPPNAVPLVAVKLRLQNDANQLRMIGNTLISNEVYHPEVHFMTVTLTLQQKNEQVPLQNVALVNIGQNIVLDTQTNRFRVYNDNDPEIVYIEENFPQEKYSTIAQLLRKAKKSLEIAAGLLPQQNGKITNLANDIAVYHDPNRFYICCTILSNRCILFCSATSYRGCFNCYSTIHSVLLFLYSLVFRFTIKNIVTPGHIPNTTAREYVFGGYKHPRKPCMVHAYFLSMMLVALNWFSIVFIDNFYFDKTTTCSDPNLEDHDYLCFDVREPFTSGPINCTDSSNIDVLCYIQSYNFIMAASLAFSFFGLVVFFIHVSFLFTLWCTKNYHWSFALLLYILVTVLYILFLVVYCPVVYATDDWQYMTEKNFILFGYRSIRPIMITWGLISCILITVFSPYTWLIDKHADRNEEHFPSYQKGLIQC